MIKNFVIFIVCVLAIYLVMKFFSKLESKIDEPYGWKTDLIFSLSALLTIVFAFIAFYNFILFVGKAFALLHH